MKFILVPLLVYAINQLIKFFILLARDRNILGSRLVWSVWWVGGFPSAHAAVLTSALYLVGSTQGLGAVFGFCLFVTIILIYGLLEDKKRQLIYESYFSQSQDPALKKVVSDKILLDFSGHSFYDVAFSVVEALALTFIITNYFIKL